MMSKITLALIVATTLSFFGVAIWPSAQTAGLFICFVVLTAMCMINE